jgi:hypothetical protein
MFARNVVKKAKTLKIHMFAVFVDKHTLTIQTYEIRI